MIINAVWIPILLTIGCLIAMFRPYHSIGDYDIGCIFRLFWILPISIIWTVYFGILLLLR